MKTKKRKFRLVYQQATDYWYFIEMQFKMKRFLFKLEFAGNCVKFFTLALGSNEDIFFQLDTFADCLYYEYRESKPKLFINSELKWYHVPERV